MLFSHQTLFPSEHCQCSEVAMSTFGPLRHVSICCFHTELCSLPNTANAVRWLCPLLDHSATSPYVVFTHLRQGNDKRKTSQNSSSLPKEIPRACII
jgi:hypothetical protein